MGSEITTKGSAAVGGSAGTGLQDTVLADRTAVQQWPARAAVGRSARLADDQRDVAFGAALVTSVTGVGGHHPGPQLRLLLR